MRAELYHSVQEVQAPLRDLFRKLRDLFRQLLEHVSGLSRLCIQCQRTSRLGPCELEIARLKMRLRERRMRGGGLTTPNRNVQCVDGFTHPSAAQVDPTHQQ